MKTRGTLCSWNTFKYLRNALIPLQAQNYDPEGEYVAYWLPQLQSLPKDKRHFPRMGYIKQVVPLKFGNAGKYQNHDKAFTARGTNFGGRRTKGTRGWICEEGMRNEVLSRVFFFSWICSNFTYELMQHWYQSGSQNFTICGALLLFFILLNLFWHTSWNVDS